MDLLGFLGAARQALDHLRHNPDDDLPWANDDVEFERHFGAPYEDFLEITQHLTAEQKKLLDATVNVNPEAAVLWILTMTKTDE